MSSAGAVLRVAPFPTYTGSRTGRFDAYGHGLGRFAGPWLPPWHPNPAPLPKPLWLGSQADYPEPNRREAPASVRSESVAEAGGTSSFSSGLAVRKLLKTVLSW